MFLAIHDLLVKMPYLRVFKYPGAKLSMIGDIENIFISSGCGNIVDVFGGSGTISLNIKSRGTVFNDLDPEIVNLFRTIKSSPDAIQEYLYERSSRNRDGKQVETQPANSRVSKGKPRKGISPEAAIYFLESHITGFGGSGNTYRTRERSVSPFFRNLYRQFPEIWKKVSGFTIENMDFRPLISKYDGADTFFYLDPPYHSKEWYRFNFRESDYEDLRTIISGIKGKYLLTMDSGDLFLEDIFGEPDFVKRYENQNQHPVYGKRPPRNRSFYTNVL
jgi:DNA adenine methylase